MDDTVEQLRITRASLVMRRDGHAALVDELNDMLRHTDRMIAVLSGDTADGLPSLPTREAPTIREAVLDVLRDGEPHHFNQFMNKLGYRGPPPKDASVRGVVSRMKRDEEIAS